MQQPLSSTSKIAERATQWLAATRHSDVLLIVNTALSVTLGLSLIPVLGVMHALVCTVVVWLNGLVILLALLAWGERWLEL
ncbi:MAG: hypothetical protein AAF730_19535 [Bacteroidota bacterium]